MDSKVIRLRIPMVAFNSFSLLFLFLFSPGLVAADAPRLYGGKCQIIQNTLYQVGGFIDVYSNDTKIPNMNYYTLDLSSNFTIDSFNEAPWVTVTPADLNQPKGEYPVTISHNDKIIMMGGAESDPDNFYRILDPKSKIWTSVSSSKNGWDELMTKYRYKSNYSLQASSIFQSDINPELYMIYGGLTQKYNGSLIYPTQVWQLNITDGQFSLFADFKIATYSHSAFVYKSKMYILGGAGSNRKSISMAILNYMDLTDGSVGQLSLEGDIPGVRGGMGTVLVNSTLYMTGGDDGGIERTYFADKYYKLDLLSLAWTQVNLTGLNSGKASCMVYYNDIMIYSFGYLNSLAQSTTFLIYLKNNSLIKTLPSSLGQYSSNNGKLPSKNGQPGINPSLGIILGSIFSSLLFSIL